MLSLRRMVVRAGNPRCTARYDAPTARVRERPHVHHVRGVPASRAGIRARRRENGAPGESQFTTVRARYADSCRQAFTRPDRRAVRYHFGARASDQEREIYVRESDIEKYLVAKAKEHGGEVRKVKWIGRRGAPDRLLMLPYKRLPSGWVGGAWTTIWVELKAPGKKPDAHQAREHARMWRMDQIVVVIDSIEGVDALFA